MMMKNQSKSSARLRPFALLPALALALLVSNSSCVKNAQDQVAETDPDESVLSEGSIKCLETDSVDAESILHIINNNDTAKTSIGHSNSDYGVPATPPEFPGGVNELYKELTKILKWNDNLKEGRVVIKFVVDIDGSMTDFSVAKGVSPETDKYALECIKQIKTKWTPGRNADGKLIKVTYSLPISFKTE